MSGEDIMYVILIAVATSWVIYGAILYLVHRDYKQQHILRGRNKEFLIYAANDPTAEKEEK